MKLLAGAVLLAVTGLAIAGDNCPYSGKSRYMRAQDWQAMCRCVDGKSTCVAATRVIGWVASIYGTAHVLRVKSSSAGPLLQWRPRLYVPDERHPVTLKVDDLPTIMLVANKGYWLDDGTVELGNPAFASNILPSMKRGRTLRIGYVDQFGGRKTAVFSLAGLTRAQNFVDSRMNKRKAAGTPKAPMKKGAAAKPTAKAAAKPAPKGAAATATRRKFE